MYYLKLSVLRLLRYILSNMKLTKYEHACLVLENEGKTLVIDPGVFTHSLPLDVSYDFIVITHEHADHIDPDKVRQIFQRNPSVQFFVNQKIFNESISKYGAKHTIIASGAKAQVAGFDLQFFGDEHAIIYQTSPCANNGVLVNKTLYYPGDSFVLPNVPVVILAVPACAPWMKIAEVIDFTKAVGAKSMFPTHNAMLSKEGESVTYNWLSQAAKLAGSTWLSLSTEEALDV